MNSLPLVFIFLILPTVLLSQVVNIPQVREVNGLVSRFEEQSGSIVPVQVGYRVAKDTLFFTDSDSELIISFPGKIVARLGENTRVVLGPKKNNRYEVELQIGTVSALLDPNRKKMKVPAFAIRTINGVTEATGTFYAVTEYKGQTYTAVKKGKVKKKVVPPPKPNFAAYLKKATSAKSKPKLLFKK
jgi:hypothetical protein